MKTTVEISDALLDDAKALAAREGTTLKAVIEAGLRKLLAERKAKPKFKLRDASVGGQGMAPELQGASWETIRELVYEGRH